MLLLHGWPQTWYAWRKVMPPLAAAGFRVIAVEYRGAGVTMAADIHRLLDRLDIERVHVVARDIGLMIGYALAATEPARWRR